MKNLMRFLPESIHNIVLVRCRNIDLNYEKKIKYILEKKCCLNIKCLYYKEDFVGAYGIRKSLMKYAKGQKGCFYALSIRGKKGYPKLYKVSDGCMSKVF